MTVFFYFLMIASLVLVVITSCMGGYFGNLTDYVNCCLLDDYGKYVAQETGYSRHMDLTCLSFVKLIRFDPHIPPFHCRMIYNHEAAGNTPAWWNLGLAW
jgi:hypothetical protein